MREVDTELVMYFKEKYGPFTTRVMENNHKHKCDFCGETQAKKIVKAISRVKKPLFVCFGCPSLDFLLEVEQAADVRYSVWGGLEKGLSDFGKGDKEFLKGYEEAQRINKSLSMPKLAPGEIPVALIAKAQNYHKAGFGKGWKIISSLLQQYVDRGSLTTKQLQVVKKFNKSCDQERARRGSN